MILIPVALSNFKEGVASELDNTKLPDFPVYNEYFTAHLEEYFSKRLGFRDEFITSYQMICLKGLGQLVHPQYMFGKNGQIYDDWDIENYQNLPVDMEYVENFKNYVKSIQDVSQDYGADFVFLYVPNKETVYPENFPDGYTVYDAPNRSDLLMKSFEEAGINYIDTRDAFKKEKNSEQLFNDKFDSGHWNKKGALFASKLLINDYLIKLHPEMGELKDEEFIFTEKVEPYLLNSRIPIYETVPEYGLANDKTIDDGREFFKDLMYAKNSYARHFVNPEKKDLPRILILGDSYFGNSNSENFYKNHSSEIIMLHGYNDIYMPYYISSFKPDIVIFEGVERAIGFNDNQYATNIIKNSFVSKSRMDEFSIKPYLDEELESDTASLDIDKTKEHFSVKGKLKTDAYALVADVGENRYYAAIDPETKEFVFTFRVEDLESCHRGRFYLTPQLITE